MSERTQRGHASMAGKLEFDPTDPVQVAVRIAQLEGVQLAAQQAFTSTAEGLSAGIRGVQSELRTVVDQLKELNKLSNAHENHSQGLTRAFEAIRELAEETRAGFSDRDDGLETWKEKHVAENQQTRERLILWNGVATGISVLAAALVAVLVYVYVGDKDAAARDLARVERETKEAQNRTQAAAETNAKALQEVERYLTQEGAITNRPYLPRR